MAERKKSRSCAAGTAPFPCGSFDFHLQKEVQNGSEHDDRGQLADLVPCWGNGGSQDVRRHLKLQSNDEPPTKLQSDVFSSGFRRASTKIDRQGRARSP